MVDQLIELLETLGYPVYLQGSMLEDEPYPDSFFTYWNDSADGDSYYSNEEGAIVWAYSLNFYSVDPELVNTKLLDAKRVLKANGWVASGAGYSVISDEPTHTGRGMSILYRQQL